MKSLLLSCLLAVSAFAQAPVVDWDKTKIEILQHFQALVRIDTSSPPGNETQIVQYLKRVLETEGIPVKIFAKDPTRANIVARLKGNGRKRPLLIMAHSDVVGVQRDKWPVDPFGAVLRDGYVWGRGTVDDKDKLAANLVVFLLLKRTGVQLDRDVIFFVESGEEADPSGVGINFMVDEHFDEIDAEYCLTEGGTARIENGSVKFVQVTTTEKVPMRVRLITKGTAGHGSVPRTDNALIRLSAAVAKVGTWETPMRLNDTTRTYFEKLAMVSAPEASERYTSLLNPQRSAMAQRWLAENEPGNYSMLRTSVVPTILKAGFRMNVIPSEAEATLDIRALPDEDPAKLFEELKRVIGDSTVAVERTGNSRPASPPSRIDTEMYRILEQVAKRVYPGAAVLPGMLTGSTDMAQLRAKGIQSYGVGPAVTNEDATNFGPHSDVERIPEASLYKLVEFMWGAVTGVAASR